MRELKDELASLRIDRDAPRRGRWRMPLVLLLLVVVAVAGGLYFVRARPGLRRRRGRNRAAQRAERQRANGGHADPYRLRLPGGAPAVGGFVEDPGTHLPAARGRGQRGEDRRCAGDAGQRDYVAAIAKAKADIEYAKADLAEAQRQERLQQDLFRRQGGFAGRARRRQSQGRTSPQPPSSRTRPTLQVQQAYLRLHHHSRAVRRQSW